MEQMPKARHARTARPVWQQPVVQFVVAGLALAALLAWVTGVLGERLAREQAIDDARTRTELIANTVIEQAISPYSQVAQGAAIDVTVTSPAGGSGGDKPSVSNLP